ncbi:Met_10 domain-containing protein/TYW3 domain-containing protein/Kelch_2 domain-containing protein/Kelch_4 domain-containing protein/Kelch_6 domain-containing protein [Cephalotus follicularis]|uniref:Met_10 domain-containing protein/TYW3 domain-containing protein/Kelch_2 domain-containing protein/Kelch_4 domain-containing protein/Kelch_6 domain-containing protein n=1 Tax=Cephalotus follicularis TaxID=3775 RepID=A0A1Q3CY96_CEPFO|nr:Met_10 domain-containing protein/TYW3 domain-containing protein/Kelch_2 domain-containing protein/Kelch_4 domain-containing protein/Kelch_6 domain-containing protein [Cephalotus follicularis]
MDFWKRKAAMIASLGSTESDKSPKGTLDTPIIPLLNTINNHPNYFTTSSCSGRISILSQPKPEPGPIKKKARGGSWLYISHHPVNPDSVISVLFPSQTHQNDDHDDLVFRFEPLIIAVECKDVESAQALVSLAISSGFRESGVTGTGKRVIVGIRCSIRLEVPLGETGRILVSREYVRFLVDVANEKMEANRKRTEGFFKLLRSDKFSVNGGGVCGDDSHEGADGNVVTATDGDNSFGPVKVSVCSISITQMVIVGEPVEKLFRWGHSACTLDNIGSREVLLFGGFGGVGRHARRNDTLLLNPSLGTLKAINIEGSPSPRLGHTSSLVGDCMFVIGGRGDPLNILSDVWIFDTAKNEWTLSECTGSNFPPRHRHAAVVVGSNIYVFGGLNNNMIFSCLHVLDTENLCWKELSVGGDQPCARHSHSMVAYRSQIFLLGGYDGEKALGDLYSFDVQSSIWKKEKPVGRYPHARFSHSMFVYKNYLGVIGGCPVRQHLQELTLLDMRTCMWKHVTLDYIGKELFVRNTANVVGDDLVMVGGGAACYAFGTKFSVPLKISLLPFMSLEETHMSLEIGDKDVTHQDESVKGKKTCNIQGPLFEKAEGSTESPDFNFGTETLGVKVGHAANWVFQLERNCAKSGKDILKKFRWLDLGRRVYSSGDGMHICFPVTENFCSSFFERQYQLENTCEGQNVLHVPKPFAGDGTSLNEISCSTAMNLLKECGTTKLADEVVKVRRIAKSPLQIMSEAISSMIEREGLSSKLLEQLPTRWERLGDIVVLPVTSFRDPEWNLIGEELWPTVARSFNTRRLARQGRVSPTGTRDSTLEILLGDNGWVYHRENGIFYSFDATKCMFSWGNLSEKLRMGHLDCRDEVIVDLFAGIGYFVLPFLVRAKAKFVYACEWNPRAVEALQHNLHTNSVSDHCIILEGDNRITAPKGVADRVCLGLLPTSEGSWLTAVRALRSTGGMLHVHGNVKDSEVCLWTEHVSKSFYEIARSEGRCWVVSVEHVERVKWYAPHICHLVADVRCQQILIH